MNPRTGSWTTSKVTMGALSDSFYEYLIKQWLLTGRQVHHRNKETTPSH